MSKQSFSVFYDMIPYIIVNAPDDFPVDYDMDLEKIFSLLNANLLESERELGEFYEGIKLKASESLEFYRSGDIKNGIKSLQAVDNIIREEKLKKYILR